MKGIRRKADTSQEGKLLEDIKAAYAKIIAQCTEQTRYVVWYSWLQRC